MPDGWYILTRPARNGACGWLAMAKREPFQTESAVLEPGELWFEFGETAAEAVEKLERGLPDAA